MLKALVVHLLESTVLSSRWFQMGSAACVLQPPAYSEASKAAVATLSLVNYSGGAFVDSAVRWWCRLTVFVYSVPVCIGELGRMCRLTVFVYSVPVCVGELGRRCRLNTSGCSTDANSTNQYTQKNTPQCRHFGRKTPDNLIYK